MSQTTRTYLVVDAEGVIAEQPEAADRLAQLKALVGGWIEITHVGGPDWLRVCVNEEGLLVHLPANRRMAGLAGPVIIGMDDWADDGERDFRGLTPEKLALVRRMTEALPLAPRDEADGLLPEARITIHRLNPDGTMGEEII